MPNHERARLSHLPAHVLRNVAVHLDRPSAVSLGLTCSAIRPIAESSIWQELNISVHRSFLRDPAPYSHTRPLGGNKLYAIREEYIWGPAAIDVIGVSTDVLGQPFSLKRYFDDLINHLQASHIRSASVQRLYIDVDRLLSSRLVSLFELVAPTLKHLEFIPPGFPNDSLSTQSHFPPTIRSIFQKLSSPLDSCRYLQLPLDLHWSQTILDVLPKVPNLRNLRLSVEQPYSGSWGETVIFPLCSEHDERWPVLPRLRSLEVNEMSPAFVLLLVTLIQSAPRLQRVSLMDPDRSWNPLNDDDLLTALACSTSLKYLACRRVILRRLEGDSTGFATVTELALHEDKQPWGLPQLESVSIPPLPAIQVLYSYTHLKEGRSITWAWDGESRGQPSPIRPISSNTLCAISAAPSMVLIQFPDSSNRERGIPISTEEWEYWGSANCFAAHDRGTLIRTYANTETGEVFTHCRSYSAHHSHIDEGIIHRSDDVWEEHVDYQGKCIRAGVLAGVYTILGESVSWKKPGRNLTLPEDAWKLLRQSCA